MSIFKELIFKHFTFEDLDKYNAYYVNLNQRFYKSFMYLTQSKKFIYTFYKDALLVFKKGHIMNNKYFYLMFPPLTKNNDIELEYEIINEMQSYGVKTKLSLSEAQKYDISFDDLIIDKGNDEFIYEAKRIVEMKGKKWSRVRSYINKNLSLYNSGDIRVEYKSRVDPITMKRLNKITDYWIKHHKNMKSIKYYLQNLNSFNCAHITYVENADKEILAYMILEDYKNEIILTMPVKNYKIDWKYDINAFVMYMTAKLWQTVYEKEYKKQHLFMNIGASVGDKGLYVNKNKYDPILIQQIYYNKVDNKLFLDIFNDINMIS